MSITTTDMDDSHNTVLNIPPKKKKYPTHSSCPPQFEPNPITAGWRNQRVDFSSDPSISNEAALPAAQALTVRPRQEAVRAVVARHQVLRQHTPQPHDIGDDVAVRDHHALRLPGRAGRVDQCRQVTRVRHVWGHLDSCHREMRESEQSRRGFA